MANAWQGWFPAACLWPALADIEHSFRRVALAERGATDHNWKYKIANVAATAGLIVRQPHSTLVQDV
jgi:hypothetical protein